MLTFRTVMAGPVPAIRSVDLPRLMAGTVAGHDDERRVTTFGFWYYSAMEHPKQSRIFRGSAFSLYGARTRSTSMTMRGNDQCRTIE